MERVSRLRSDAVSTPLYGIALLESIMDMGLRLIEAQRLFKARS